MVKSPRDDLVSFRFVSMGRTVDDIKSMVRNLCHNNRLPLSSATWPINVLRREEMSVSSSNVP